MYLCFEQESSLRMGVSMFSFGWPLVLILLPLPLLFLFSRKAEEGSAKLHFPGSASRTAINIPNQAIGNWQRLRRYGLPFLIWACTVVAAAQPRWLGEPI